MLIGVWLPGQESEGWGALYDGTARQLERRWFGSLDDPENSPGHIFGQTDKLVLLLPEADCYWFRLPVPFRNHKKIHAVLPALLTDWWPDDVDEVAWRFAVQPAGESFEAMVCGVRKQRLQEIDERLQTHDLSVDFLTSVSAHLLADEQVLPVLLWTENGASIFLPTASSVPWQWLALQPDQDPAEAVRGWLQAISRGPDGAGLAGQLQNSEIYESAIGGQNAGLGRPFAPVETVLGEETDLDTGMFDRLALQVFARNTFDFADVSTRQRRGKRWMQSVGWRPVAAAAVLLISLLLGSTLSLQAKRASVEHLRHSYRELFLRAFPGQKLGGNLLKKGRALLNGDTPTEEGNGVEVLAALTSLGTALPDRPEVMLRSAKLSQNTWNLNGICDDFGCVDTFRNALGRLDHVKEVKLQNAKQTIDQKAVKFTITIDFGGSEP